MSRISIIVPTKNEENSIEELIESIHVALTPEKIIYEIIVVDDYSSDKTQSLVKKLSHIYPVKLQIKKGNPGKSFSLTEGFQQAKYEYLAMIDADLQYSPEAIPEMIKLLDTYDVIVGNRKHFNTSFLRRCMSKTFKFFFGKMLFGMNLDVQSGLKVFRREVYETVKFIPRSPWTFDLEFLLRARESGYTITNHQINFIPRKNGTSSIQLIKSTLEISLNSLKLKKRAFDPVLIPPHREKNMRGAGIRFNGKKYVTHTTLPYSKSAIITVTPWQKFILVCFAGAIIIGVLLKPLLLLEIIIAVLSTFYFIDGLFTLYIILKSLHSPQELRVKPEELSKLKDQNLPVYTILCPLYREAHVVSQFITALSKLDWPKEKLDAILLLEEDDASTIEAIRGMKLPAFMRILIIPHSQPKTKPKACNYGLSFAKGEYLVIYDAEDQPEPQQLKKAYAVFQKVDEKVLCLQAKLNYYNPNQNLLTRFFTAEYSLWFDVTLTGLQSINTSIPLGGTSNHFRTKDLLSLKGWDPFNVTEDADLGVRLFQEGYKTAIIDSTTFEEANSKLRNWILQRSRWIKGYMQTYLIHTRQPQKLSFKNICHEIIFQLVVGGKILFILINPFLWIATIAYFTLFSYVGPTIESLYSPLIFYSAVVSLVFGNFLFLYYYMIGCIKREQWNLVKYVYFIPLYWIAISYAGFVALYQLILKPHYWEKTVHGLHKTKKKQKTELIIEIEIGGDDGARSAKNKLSPLFLFERTKRNKKQSISKKVPFFFLTNWKFYLTSRFLKVIKEIKKNGEVILYEIILSITAFVTTAFLCIFLMGNNLNPWFLSYNTALISHYLSLFGYCLLFITTSTIFISFYLKKKVYPFAFIPSFLCLLQFASGYFYPGSIQVELGVMVSISILNFIIVLLLHLDKRILAPLEYNGSDLLYLFAKNEFFTQTKNSSKVKILIFNWRDIKHTWAGGAENYIHQLSKRFVQNGANVLVFCGNDYKCSKNQITDGVYIMRRGGFYTMYFWAFLYYIFQFRGKFDVIIDSENGIPFFSPIYSARTIFLLVHHIHQEVFLEHLEFPFSNIARFLEGKAMPFIYSNKKIITVSESSKKEIQKLNFTSYSNIHIVNPGINLKDFERTEKTHYPSFIYLGRLKPYKNIDIALRAFAKIVPFTPDAKFSIVGEGESMHYLKELAYTLGIQHNVEFLGKVSEKKKVQLLGRSWVALQPSMIEGWGITVIESNACGTPVIASNVNGLRDSILDQRTGVLVQPRQVDEFAYEMSKIIFSKQYRETLSHQAYSWAQNFNWDTSANEFYSIILASLEEDKSFVAAHQYTLTKG